MSYAPGGRRMVTLGKVHAPKPVNLPSQKRENNGLDPNVPIVPRGLPGAACWSGAGQDGQDRHPSPGQEPQQPPANAWVNRGPSPQPSGKPPPQQGHPPPHQQQHPSGPVAWGGAGLPDQRKRQHDRWAGDFPQLGNDVPPREGSAGRQSGQDSFGHGPDEISVRSRQHPEHPGAQPPPDYQRGTVGFNHTRDGPPSSGQGYDGPVGGQHDRRFAGYPHGSLSGGSGDYPGPYRGPPPPPPPPPTGHRTSLGPQGAPPPHVGAGPYSHQHLHYKDGLPPPGSRYHQGRGPPGPGWQPPTGRYGQSPNRGPPEGRWDHRGCAPPRSDSMPPMRAPPNCYANSQMPRSTDAPPPSQRKTSLPPGPILVDHGDHDWSRMAESDGDSSTVPTPHFKDMDDEASSTSSGPTGPVEPRPPRFMSTPQILTRQSAPEVLAAATAAAAAKNPKQTEQGRSDGQPEAEKQESDSAAAVEQHEEQDVDKKHDSDMRKGSLEVPQGIEIGKDPNQQSLLQSRPRDGSRMVEASSLGKGEGRGESKASVNDQDGKISGGKDERHAEREKSTRNRRKEREKRDRVERSISEGERRPMQSNTEGDLRPMPKDQAMKAKQARGGGKPVDAKEQEATAAIKYQTPHAVQPQEPFPHGEHLQGTLTSAPLVATSALPVAPIALATGPAQMPPQSLQSPATIPQVAGVPQVGQAMPPGLQPSQHLLLQQQMFQQLQLQQQLLHQQQHQSAPQSQQQQTAQQFRVPQPQHSAAQVPAQQQLMQSFPSGMQPIAAHLPMPGYAPVPPPMSQGIMGQPASDALPVACIPMTPASAPGHMMAMVPPMMMHTHPSLPMQPQIMQQQMSAAQFHVQQLGPRPMAVPPPPPPPQGHAPHHGALGHQQQQMVQQMQQLHMQQSLQKQESPPHQPLKPEPHHHDLQEQQQHRDAQKVVESQPFAKVDKEAGGGGKEADRAGAGDRGGHGLGKGGSSRIRRGSTGRGMQGSKAGNSDQFEHREEASATKGAGAGSQKTPGGPDGSRATEDNRSFRGSAKAGGKGDKGGPERKGRDGINKQHQRQGDETPSGRGGSGHRDGSAAPEHSRSNLVGPPGLGYQPERAAKPQRGGRGAGRGDPSSRRPPSGDGGKSVTKSSANPSGRRSSRDGAPQHQPDASKDSGTPGEPSLERSAPVDAKRGGFRGGNRGGRSRPSSGREWRGRGQGRGAGSGNGPVVSSNAEST